MEESFGHMNLNMNESKFRTLLMISFMISFLKLKIKLVLTYNLFFYVSKRKGKMTLENTGIKQLFELYTLLFESNYSYDKWPSEGLSYDDILEVLVEDILLRLEHLNYDGPNDYNAIY